MIQDLVSQFQPGRLMESLVFLMVLLWKIKPHLAKADARMEGLEKGLGEIKDQIKKGFAMGETRFVAIEKRLDIIENNQGGKNGTI